jgi:hypothetical protein
MTPIIQTHTSPPGTKTTTHQFSTKSLTPGTTYYLEIFSEGTWYDDAGRPISITLP